MQMSFFKQCVGTSLQYCMLLHKTYIVHSHSRVLSVELHVMFLKIGARALLLVLQHEAARGRHDRCRMCEETDFTLKAMSTTRYVCC